MKILRDGDIFGLLTFVMLLFFSNKLVNVLNIYIYYKMLLRENDALEKVW